MGTVGVCGDSSTGAVEVGKVERAVGTVEAKGIAVEIERSSSGNSCRGSTLNYGVY